jgi:hypothetical protein
MKHSAGQRPATAIPHNGPMDDQRYCRLRVIGENLDLAGSPSALRALAEQLRAAPPTTEIRLRNGLVVQEQTAGPLAVALRGSPSLHLTGAPDNLELVWSALESVAAEAEAADGQGVEPHRHIEHTGPDDTRRAPGTRPLVITADWPVSSLD